MRNLMDTYLNFTEKKIKKYIKTIFAKYYDEDIVSEYLKTYINARYYNVLNRLQNDLGLSYQEYNYYFGELK